MSVGSSGGVEPLAKEGQEAARGWRGVPRA